MKYFLDTEFIENGSTIDLLSIGVVAEDGREFYQCNQDARLNNADEWVIWKVFPHLGVKHSAKWYWDARRIDVDNRSDRTSTVIPHYEIRDRLKEFIGSDPSPEFWAYYADYDWIAVCQLFGRMIDLPKNWPKYCNDIKQLAMSVGNIRLPKQESSSHHALNDARWVRQAYEFLKGAGA